MAKKGHEEKTIEGAPGPRARTVRLGHGEVIEVPQGWELLEPGDAALTRRVKGAGPSWTIKEKRGRRSFSQGVWAPGETIAQERARREGEKRDPAYLKKLEAGRARRAKDQERYEENFTEAVRAYLGFDDRWRELEGRLAEAVATHATPVGSGTVARTKRIPIEQRAEAAVIAWMRHQTTAYDQMRIARIRGRRREVRRALARRSVELLESYRRGEEMEPTACPLQKALDT